MYLLSCTGNLSCRSSVANMLILRLQTSKLCWDLHWTKTECLVLPPVAREFPSQSCPQLTARSTISTTQLDRLQEML